MALRRARWAVAALALGALGLGIVACGGGDDSSGAATPACGPGTTLKNGVCAPACGAGTVFDAASGSCVGSAGGSGGGGGSATGGGGGSAMAGTSGGGMAGEGGMTSGGAGGAAGEGGGGGQPGGSGGGSASYCPPVIDLNCDPACGAVHPSCSIGYCVKYTTIDLSQMKDTYVVQLPTAPVTSHCCSGKDRYILHYETGPGLTGMNYRMRFPAGNNGWVAAGADTPSGYCLGPLGPPQGVCALPKTPRWTFVTDAVQVPPTTVIFEKTKAACPLVRHEPNALQLIC